MPISIGGDVESGRDTHITDISQAGATSSHFHVIEKAIEDEAPIEEVQSAFDTLPQDMIDVAVTTFQNPLAGLGLVVHKIADKAKLFAIPKVSCPECKWKGTVRDLGRAGLKTGMCPVCENTEVVYE